jgi:hypothetical protein
VTSAVHRCMLAPMEQCQHCCRAEALSGAGSTGAVLYLPVLLVPARACLAVWRAVVVWRAQPSQGRRSLAASAPRCSVPLLAAAWCLNLCPGTCALLLVTCERALHGVWGGAGRWPCGRANTTPWSAPAARWSARPCVSEKSRLASTPSLPCIKSPFWSVALLCASKMRRACRASPASITHLCLLSYFPRLPPTPPPHTPCCCFLAPLLCPSASSLARTCAHTCASTRTHVGACSCACETKRDKTTGDKRRLGKAGARWQRL